ncbi:MAG: serine--tRNA ligase [Kiritimatiellaeota bacterium]|nr:serine--tRNA ligase [Kiritimatiellota bacterium]
MIDIRLLRENPEKVRENCRRRGSNADVDAILARDAEYRRLLRETEDLRASRKRLSQQARTDPAAREKVRGMKPRIAENEKRIGELRAEIHDLMAWLPNFLAEDVPPGHSDQDNEVVRLWGEKREFDFEPQPHDVIGERLGIIDTARGAKVAQAGFYFWCGAGAQLATALFFWAQQELVKRGFRLMIPPCAAKPRTLFGTGYLPFASDQIYRIQGEDLALVGTSEQTLVGYHADELLNSDDLPLRYTAFSPCFRTEAGSYGREVRGIFRVHQFHKVEQIVFCLPQASPELHEECQRNEEELVRALGVPYRVVNVCVGDMGAPGYKKYDVEAWFPGYGGYREVTSNTNLTDFQARRLGIRFRRGTEKGFVHTISATGVTDRLVCAVLENFQQADGSVVVPPPLRPYTGFDRIAFPG